MDLNQPPNQPQMWRCSWIGENGQRKRVDQQQSLRATTEPARIINNDAPAPVGNIAGNNTV